MDIIQTKTRPGFDEKMTNHEINDLPLFKYDGPFKVVDHIDELSLVVEALQKDKVLGFDIEIRPAFKKGQSYPPSLLQLAGEKGVYIIQLKDIGLPNSLIDLFENPEIIKAGVSVDFDVIKLNEIRQFNKKGFLDLAKIAKRAGLKNFGLRGLAAVLLGFRIPKGAQRTNWAKKNLTQHQLRYAAADAWVGREIYFKLQKVDILVKSQPMAQKKV